MIKFRSLVSIFALVTTSVATHAATTIVNLNASPTSPNAGNSSSGYAYNPVNLSLGAGTYTVGVVGIGGGGVYDAFAVYAPTAGNAAWTDGDWSVTLDGGNSVAYAQPNVGGTVADFDGGFKSGRYNSGSAALAAYAAAAPYTFTLVSAQSVGFYVDDSFGDDSGGISLAVTSVPEPASLGLLALGVTGTALGARRRSSARMPG